MKNLSVLSSRHLLGLALAAVAAISAGQLQAGPTSSKAGGGDTSMRQDTGVSEPGTIPAARPGLPTLARGAEGPIRSDPYQGTDPSIRDSLPLTINGLWETQPGNAVVRPKSQ